MAKPAKPRGLMSSLLRRIILLALLVVAAGGVAFWYYVVRDTAPPAADLVSRSTVANSGTADGTWKVQTGAESFAGFRITERFRVADHTAVVRSSAVSGSLTVSGATIDAVSVTVDLTRAQSKDAQPPGPFPVSNRIGQMRRDGLETDRFPTAKFELSEPITLAARPAVGAKITAQAAGKLTLHGVTKAVSIPVSARWNGVVVDVSGSLPIVLADYGMAPPRREFVTVSDRGTMEFQLTFAKA